MICLAEMKPATEPTTALASPLVRLDPLQEPAWDSMVAAHPGGNFFHSRAWAQVLNQTYGHQPAYFCRFAGGKLQELLPIMEVASWLTGRRGVSLPFTDYCAPLQAAGFDGAEIYEHALDHGRQRGWRYLECRGLMPGWQSATPSLGFHGHVVDLQAGQNLLYNRLEGAVRRGIKKAEEAKLRVEFSSDLESIRTYYALHCQTRRGHGLPPQPLRFFENIARYVLERGLGFVATVRCEGQPVAGAVFFQQGAEVLFKFGASNHSFQHLRPNNFMTWETIKRCAGQGFQTLHLGRTSLTNDGLRRFKQGFGAREERIDYYRYSFDTRSFIQNVDRAESWANRVFRPLPLPLLRLAGSLLYPHLS